METKRKDLFGHIQLVVITSRMFQSTFHDATHSEAKPPKSQRETNLSLSISDLK